MVMTSSRNLPPRGRAIATSRVADFKSERPRSNRNRWPPSFRNQWPASSGISRRLPGEKYLAAFVLRPLITESRAVHTAHRRASMPCLIFSTFRDAKQKRFIVGALAKTVEHCLAAARPAKQEDAQLPRNVDLHLVDRKGAALTKRFVTPVHASPRQMGNGPIIRGSA